MATQNLQSDTLMIGMMNNRKLTKKLADNFQANENLRNKMN